MVQAKDGTPVGLAHPALVRMWLNKRKARFVKVRPGIVRLTCPPLAHTRRSRDHILTAATTIVHEKGNFTTTGCFPDCSVISGNPSTE